MTVNSDAQEEYKCRHDPIWDELQNALKEHGVYNYSIFLEPQTNQLFAYVEIESEDLWTQIAETDACRRWWAFMKDLMPTNEDNSPIAKNLDEVFHLN
jgi:L-rhamnose mutarotase